MTCVAYSGSGSTALTQHIYITQDRKCIVCSGNPTWSSNTTEYLNYSLTIPIDKLLFITTFPTWEILMYYPSLDRLHLFTWLHREGMHTDRFLLHVETQQEPIMLQYSTLLLTRKQPWPFVCVDVWERVWTLGCAVRPALSHTQDPLWCYWHPAVIFDPVPLLCFWLRGLYQKDRWGTASEWVCTPWS